ncbi:2'-5' RNA ligase family protein [Amycolatopsis methanolica]|uniref:2'-5' RNA ligase n=1 Tax=Amycolatopsis methanolica 239 TaxID=1068978 RepID=A0A076MRD1_AMYME|nr:2'-5' RNA ligase family protein [Amycolatopsis methanolica]AIJ23448.1 hypothetical protein AMETH_3356 [Amycolatopsis methanolica 239]
MTERGRSVLAIPVPAADPLLARAAELSPAARPGLPAHISLLYPFRPAADLHEATVTALADVLERQPAMEVRFERCHHHDGFEYLRPDPLQPLTGLIAALRRGWPGSCLPYDGRFGEDVGARDGRGPAGGRRAGAVGRGRAAAAGAAHRAVARCLRRRPAAARPVPVSEPRPLDPIQRPI